MEFQTPQLRQQDMVLNHLKEHGKITPLQALRTYGCLRLAAIVHRLRQEGHAIRTDWRQQGGSRYACYRFEKPSEAL